MTNDSTQNSLPLRLLIICGLGGVLVDFFDGIALLTSGPRWLHWLDGFTAILFTILIGCVVACSHLRHNRTGTCPQQSEG